MSSPEMDITNPRRILAVAPEDAAHHLSKVVKDLTGSAPEPTADTLAGITHLLALKTAYYTASVPIWLDLISTPAEWSASFLASEAKEVLDVLGGIVLVFPLPMKPDTDEGKAARELIRHVGKVVQDGLGGWAWDGVSLCLGVGEIDNVDEWDECAAAAGLEFVQIRAQTSETRNEFGEKTGIPRAREALEANDWAQAGDDLGSDFGDFEAALGEDADAGSPHGKDTDLDPENLDFGFDRRDFEGLRHAIWSAGQYDEEDSTHGGEPNQASDGKETREAEGEGLDDEDVQKLEGMMRKLQGVRDMSAGLPEDQRKRMAAKAVSEVMKDL